MSALPTWDQFMAPSLRALPDGEVHRARLICEAAADQLGFTDGQRLQKIPSEQLRYYNRAMWALSYLGRFGAADRPLRGRYRITGAGRRLLANNPGGITDKHLRALAGDPHAPHTYYALKAMKQSLADDEDGEPTPPSGIVELDPVEQIQDGVARLHETVAADLLSACTAAKHWLAHPSRLFRRCGESVRRCSKRDQDCRRRPC